MKYFPTVRCPYCNTENTITVDPEDHSYPFQIVVCDLENRGCDLPFVVDVKITVNAAPRAIDGIMSVYAEEKIAEDAYRKSLEEEALDKVYKEDI